jgi:hypothetical protein
LFTDGEILTIAFQPSCTLFFSFFFLLILRGLVLIQLHQVRKLVTKIRENEYFWINSRKRSYHQAVCQQKTKERYNSTSKAHAIDVLNLFFLANIGMISPYP